MDGLKKNKWIIGLIFYFFIVPSGLYSQNNRLTIENIALEYLLDKIISESNFRLNLKIDTTVPSEYFEMNYCKDSFRNIFNSFETVDTIETSNSNYLYMVKKKNDPSYLNPRIIRRWNWKFKRLLSCRKYGLLVSTAIKEENDYYVEIVLVNKSTMFYYIRINENMKVLDWCKVESFQ